MLFCNLLGYPTEFSGNTADAFGENITASFLPFNRGSDMKALLRNAFYKYLSPELFLHIRFVLKHKYMPNTHNPITFNEKVLAKILFDRSPLLATVADKLTARDFIISRIGNGYLPELYAIWDDADLLKLDPEWRSVVIKANHGSGSVKVVTDAPNAEVGAIKAAAARWLKENYGSNYGEWCYSNIKPKLFAEEMIGSDDHDELIDYKIFCFSGEPRFLKIIKGMKGDTKSYYADLNFKKLPISDGQKSLEVELQTAPANSSKMFELARKLSVGFDMIRIDMYNIDGRIYIGELTNYPQAGAVKISPKQGDIDLGRFWTRESMSYLPSQE